MLCLRRKQLPVFVDVPDDLKIIPIRREQMSGITMPDCERPGLIDNFISYVARTNSPKPQTDERCANNISFVNFLAVLVLEAGVLHQFDVLWLKHTVDADLKRHPVELDDPATRSDQIFRLMHSL